jgi:Flp pilus assembly pilin Flp
MATFTLQVRSLVARLLDGSEGGQALVEYTLILALVSIVGIALLTSVGASIVTDLTNVVNAL